MTSKPKTIRIGLICNHCCHLQMVDIQKALARGFWKCSTCLKANFLKKHKRRKTTSHKKAFNEVFK